jgi:drug/metabolite transporter (DMT)-like permease
LRHDPRLAYLLVNLSTLLWAGNITLGRALRGQVGPLTLTAARVTIAGLLFVLLFARQSAAGQLPAAERHPGRDWPLLLGMALTGLINGTGPLVTAMLAAWLLREKLHTNQIVGGFVSLAGVVLIIGNGFRAHNGSGPNLGDLIMLANVALWGLYSVMARVVTHRRSTVSATAFSTWAALPLLLPLALIESGQKPPELSPNVLLAVLYIGVFAAFVAFLAWNEGIRRVGPTRAMAFYNMLPVYGALLGALFLNEALGTGQVVGGALVIGGGLIGTSLWKFASKA